ncbi:MAG: 6-phosphogluconolactonase [Spirochaetaceae bacterium]|jgi:6-phosphogluconolactonase/glucosamine-6-phosphate isomerase/deaminase|nr:6-phosphogluconolactonase [Spirochaetaceae bacterium]
MKTMIFESPVAAAVHGADTLASILRAKPEALICLAAGHSSLPFFDAVLERGLDLSRARFVELDEWLDIPPDTPGSCASFMRDNFFSRIGVREAQLCLFDPLTKDPAEECRRVEGQIGRWGGIDYLLLGMGMNGHLGLNEPGSGFAEGARAALLSRTTLEVAPKYFPAGMPPITRGITLGIADILAARRIQLLVLGARKREIVRRLHAAGTPDPDFPATALLDADQAELLLDRAAAGE